MVSLARQTSGTDLFEQFSEGGVECSNEILKCLSETKQSDSSRQTNQLLIRTNSDKTYNLGNEYMYMYMYNEYVKSWTPRSEWNQVFRKEWTFPLSHVSTKITETSHVTWMWPLKTDCCHNDYYWRESSHLKHHIVPEMTTLAFIVVILTTVCFQWHIRWTNTSTYVTQRCKCVYKVCMTNI